MPADRDASAHFLLVPARSGRRLRQDVVEDRDQTHPAVLMDDDRRDDGTLSLGAGYRSRSSPRDADFASWGG